MKKKMITSCVNFSCFIGIISVVFFLGEVVFFSDFLCDLTLLPIILGGALSATMIAFTPMQIGLSFNRVVRALFLFPEDEANIALNIMHASELAYTGSILSLQKNYARQLQAKTFWKTGIDLLLDGTSVEQCNQIMQEKIAQSYAKAMNDVLIFNTLAKLTFVMGIVTGFLFFISQKGIVNTEVLLPVLYGIILAFLFLKPLALRQKQYAYQDMVNAKLCLIGFKAIDCAQNPHKTEAELNALLPLHKQIHYFEG